MMIDKRILNFLVIIVLSFATFNWTFFIFHMPFEFNLVASVIVIRVLASFFIFKDYSLSWSKASQKTFLIKSSVYIVAFWVYFPIFYGHVRFSFLISELFLYIFCINFSMYLYYFLINRSKVVKTKSVVIYGAGKAGIKIESEFANSAYKVKYFVDDEKIIQNRSIDSIKVISKEKLKSILGKNKFDLLVIAMPSAHNSRVKEIYDSLSGHFREIQVLPSIDDILRDKDFASQLKDISVEDLLARHPKDLDKNKISSFIKDKTILVTGAGGSIGSEICRQCEKFGAKKLILLDHSEYNLYAIIEELKKVKTVPVMQSVVNKNFLDETFKSHLPDIVIHAAAYKHVPLVESNIDEAILNNIIGTKNVIDLSIKYGVEKFIMISTDKAVRPTNVMGTTKRICELYAQNSNGNGTDIVAVRFGNVLGSSGSVIPKFKAQIAKGEDITVTHPDITRYFMLIPEACELVLQAGAIGTGGEIFILDMGEPIRIVDLAQKMINLSGREEIKIRFTGLRPGEKLYEELLIDDSDCKTDYESITVAAPSPYDIVRLNKDIEELLACGNKLEILKKIVPEFNHQLNSN
ncbi:MAG: UDP-N-acetylglucosamine 4,6-dehydratase (configuration-retaining) [Epsilonproteobacteria bacterium]|nr:UDP-N-acetylglucosamine 4,6-dehydratase (configuration-retaining) [Campylobacterota bacterium]PIP11195.1 MAG: dTDP-glucose 4,6-dehydratase [Sulfurimonas sp. CG23_combo_of_CG06-09_8_20_14_all_36_33]PIS27080.1 MAG: polysaccharide biosynthesis protein [Sulfurimonas sp. CG08_land_8_20_14_0_20_36_33]PIU33686.1 MAG: polysaccharide biosynthesis protein [Sulfurimonas sp. CG07_land_8_20_14_0_80_36_56]PIV05284.1 MAG: polysaccharide biosynthesis protein [Sulfurimonas sp. CG03_land_8_20_14_0_80_36_25]P